MVVVRTNKGVVLVVGCSHPKMTHIFNTAEQFGKIYAIVGGLHGFHEFELFKGLKLICPTHSTQYKAKIKVVYPEQYVEAGVGGIIVL